MNLLFLFFLFAACGIYGETASFENLNDYKSGESIEIKGFLYQSRDGQWILSAEPNLKSCCVGSAGKKSHQIVLKGNFQKSQINQVLHVKGILKKEQGNFMEELSVINKKRPWHAAISLSFAVLACIFFFIYRMGRSSKSLKV